MFASLETPSESCRPQRERLSTVTCWCILVKMNALEDVPFQTMLGPLEEEVQLVTAPDITVPDCQQILRDNEYKFSLEKRILSGQVYQAPSCPPYWLLFYSPQDSRRSRRRSHRSRSHSLSAEDSHRTVKFLVPDSEDEDGYYDDNEGSSDDARRPIKMRERPWSAAPKDPIARVKDMELGPSTCHCRPVSPQSARGQRGTLPSRQDSRQSLRPLQTSPLLGQKSTKKRTRSLGPVGRKPPQNTPPPSRPQQQRPSSAGPAWKNRKQTLRTGGPRGVFFDSTSELLSALSLEERELLETITERGYPLRTAILALQKTGYRSPDKILKYLKASDRLCGLGYDEAQVEEALEMFQNCESKAAEFLRLLTQFNEMGFQQSAIKEVLLVNENHRERALEELMTRMA
ncbi:ubiquitin-associated protein 1-like [Larimichthys crocea]|uniref:ubiquitin-associated protein 1-like n=1 Tax=Larimichthys crocea TaxID=215358 RepID=UPI000F5E3D15|nr:ubiquitin-associated protein 1-like [Larimichthys crocea]